MLHLYTLSKVPSKYRLIFNVEVEFKVLYRKHWEKLKDDKVVQLILKVIDHSDLENGTSLLTPFGPCHVLDCSTGSKAAILAYFYSGSDRLVNAVECGANVF